MKAWQIHPSEWEYQRVTEDEWRVEVATAITQLAQEVHRLNPGIVLDFNLFTVRAPVDGELLPEEE